MPSDRNFEKYFTYFDVELANAGCPHVHPYIGGNLRVLQFDEMSF